MTFKQLADYFFFLCNFFSRFRNYFPNLLPKISIQLNLHDITCVEKMWLPFLLFSVQFKFRKINKIGVLAKWLYYHHKKVIGDRICPIYFRTTSLVFGSYASLFSTTTGKSMNQNFKLGQQFICSIAIFL